MPAAAMAYTRALLEFISWRLLEEDGSTRATATAARDLAVASNPFAAVAIAHAEVPFACRPCLPPGGTAVGEAVGRAVQRAEMRWERQWERQWEGQRCRLAPQRFESGASTLTHRGPYGACPQVFSGHLDPQEVLDPRGENDEGSAATAGVRSKQAPAPAPPPAARRPQPPKTAACRRRLESMFPVTHTRRTISAHEFLCTLSCARSLAHALLRMLSCARSLVHALGCC